MGIVPMPLCHHDKEITATGSQKPLEKAPEKEIWCRDQSSCKKQDNSHLGGQAGLETYFYAREWQETELL